MPAPLDLAPLDFALIAIALASLAVAFSQIDARGALAGDDGVSDAILSALV